MCARAKQTRRIGWIGLGTMGLPMALRLADKSGCAVYGCDIVPAAMDAFASMGGIPEPDSAALLENSDVVFLSLPDNALVQETLTDAVRRCRRGTVVVDTSSSLPAVIQSCAARPPRGRRADRLPRQPPARKRPAEGRLSAMCGGSETALARVSPLLACFAARVTHMGSLGSGYAAKLINNLIVGGEITLIAEALGLARKARAGHGAAAGGALRRRRVQPRSVSEGRQDDLRDYTPSSRVLIHLKDQRNAQELARAMGAAIPGLRPVHRAARAAGGHGARRRGRSRRHRPVRIRSTSESLGGYAMATYEKEFLLKVLENLWKVRKFEQRAMEGGLKGEIKGNIHVCLGEEGAVVGANMALEPTDYITASHRGHGHCVMKSDDLEHTLAELYGKESGFCHGRGGSMHVTKAESGLLGANGIVGGGIPLATGSALASKISHDGAVSVAFFGDGASNQGCFHECINMAAVWKLPIVYFIENNQFAVSTDIHTTCATPTLAQRAQGYGIEGIIVDGTDVLAVYEAMQRAVEHARSGKGPVLLECDVYRYTGHYVGDPAKYMSVEYNTAAHQNDVIDKFKTYLLAEGVASQGELDAVEAAVEERMEKAYQFALDAPLPDPADVLKYNYACDNERSVAR